MDISQRFTDENSRNARGYRIFCQIIRVKIEMLKNSDDYVDDVEVEMLEEEFASAARVAIQLDPTFPLSELLKPLVHFIQKTSNYQLNNTMSLI